MIKLGYARVSTGRQKTDNQLKKLEDAGCAAIFQDRAISGSSNRSADGFVALMARIAELRANGEEVQVCVTKFDRFSRSLEELLTSIRELDDLGASFHAIDDGFIYDPSSPFSKLILQVFGALAEFERALIRSRMDEGRDAKVAKGLRLGAKPKLTQAAVDAIKSSYAEGEGKTPDQLSVEWDISKALVGRVLGIYPSLAPYVTLDEWNAAKVAANAKEPVNG